MITLTDEERAEATREAIELEAYKKHPNQGAFLEGYLHCVLVHKLKASLTKAQDARDPDEQNSNQITFGLKMWWPLAYVVCIVLLLTAFIAAIKFLN